MNRYREGYIDVRNPFNPNFVSRINFSDIDAIFFCTKNPIPIIDSIKEIKKPILFHVPVTSYKNDIEPNVISKRKIIEAIKQLSLLLGKDNVVVRYDPIFISDKYSLAYHIKAFENYVRILMDILVKYLFLFLMIIKM